MSVFEVSLAVEGPKAALAWYGGEAGEDVVHLRWLHPNGASQGSPIRVTDGPARALEPDLVLIGGDPLLAWYEKQPDTGALTAWLARLKPDGTRAWRRPLSGAGGMARNPVVRERDGVIHVAWIETPPGAAAAPVVWAAEFAPDGRSRGAPRPIALADRKTWNLNAAVDAKGIFYVVYDARLGARASELHLAAVDGARVRNLRLSADDGQPSVYPDLVLNPDGQAALAWSDRRDGNAEIYLAVAPPAALAEGGRLPARRITRTPAASTGAYLAWNHGVLALVWCDAEAGQKELYAQTFATTGQPLSDIRRLTRSATESSIPSIRASGRGFLIGWNEYSSGEDDGHGGVAASVAMARRFDDGQ